ncbi:MAG: protein kinase [Myxococcales bacterium]|nr:protein kinase [Myxococcales bacterium]
MASDSIMEVLQGELERLFDLDGLMALSSNILGFDPEVVGGTGTKGAFARSLVGYCNDQEAIDALVDAILLSADGADAGLRQTVNSAPNGELKPGARVGGMKIVKKIGEGGLSVVYLAEREGDGEEADSQRAALKVIRPQYARDRGAVHRFTTASRVMQTLEAPGLVPIFSVGQLDDRRPWVAAEYLTGQTLADRIKRTGSLHVNEARPIFTGVLLGLGALHRRGLVHGDVKVENVFVMRPKSDEGRSEPTGVLVDGGADRLLTRIQQAATATGLLPVFGTPKAIAPEQARGLETDVRSDIYQMGTLMYEALAGKPPFEGDSAIDVIAQHLSAAPTPPSAHARKGWVSEQLDNLVLRALAKDPAERFGSAQELLEALEGATSKPRVQKPLDEVAYGEAKAGLLGNPDDTTWADALEELAAESGAWPRVAEALTEAANAAEGITRIALLLRVARIYETEAKEALRAEAAYQQILELDPDNSAALRGVETAKRASGDHEGLLEILLDRVENEEDAEARQRLLREVASIYENQLRDPENALVAYTQALISDLSDDKAVREIERIAGSQEARWAEVLEMLSQSAQEAQAALFTDEEEQRQAAQAQLEEAQGQLEQVRTAIDAQRDARREQDVADQAGQEAQLQQAEAALESAQQELTELEAKLEQAAQTLGEATQKAEAIEAEAAEKHAEAETKVEAYEKLEEEAGEEPSDEQAEQLEALAGEAESLVEQATTLEEHHVAASEAVESARANMLEVQSAFDEAQARVSVAEQEAADRRLLVEGQHPTDAEPSYTEEERAQLEAAESQLSEAAELVASFAERDAAEAAAQREADLAELVRTYVRMGRWYGDRIHRPDFALSCYSQALNVDAASSAAYEGVIDLYRDSQSWGELAATLLQWADKESSPVKAREHRAEAAVIIANKLGDGPQARSHLEQVLAEDPAHPVAQSALAEILGAQQDWSALRDVLESRLDTLKGDARGSVHKRLGELYEQQLQDVAKAAAHYAALLELDPRNGEALQGLERVYSAAGNYEGLLESLRSQVELATTPKQRIGLLERIGLILEEEFVDHAGAAQCFEDIVAVDAAHDAANAALARIYRHLQRFEDVVEALDRQAAAVANEQQKIDLMLQAARVLSVDIGSPDRAMEMYEEVLSINDLQPEALSELARLNAVSGDAAAAVDAVERLAEQEQDEQKQAQLWVRAGNLLREAGDRESAISRYKKALDLNKYAAEAAEALREIYMQRGDARGAAEMLIHGIGIADGELKRAALLTELGALYRDQLHEGDEAKVAFEEALELDPTSTVAAVGLSRIALGEGETEQGVEYYESVKGRLDELPPAEAAQLCTEVGDAYKNLSKMDEAVGCYEKARDLLPDDLEYSRRHAAIVMEAGDFASAERLHDRILKKFEAELDDSERARVHRERGEAQLANKHTKRAIESFNHVLELRAEDPEALEALTRAHEAARDWNEVINLLQLRSRRTSDEDTIFELLVKTGDVFLDKIRDRDAASQTYVMALDVKPDNRNLLTKLMGVYSDAQDWPRLIEVILRIAEMVGEAAQKAKYYNTAASIAHLELGRFDEAANYYEAALSNMIGADGDSQFEGLVACLTENQDWDRLERAYQGRIERLRSADASDSKIAGLMSARAHVIQTRLGRLAEALSIFEEALSLEPDNEDRRQMLTAIYTKEPKRFFDRAVAAHRYYLGKEPARVESLQALRKIYTSAKRPDESWCMCQALRCLKVADGDEEKFFKKYRLSRLAKTKQPITDELWRNNVLHPGQDAYLTAIFATLQPAVVATQSQKLAAFSVRDRDRIDPAHDTTAMGRMLAHVADTMTTHLPPVYDCQHDAGGLSFLFAVPPSIGIGQGAKAGGPQQALAFVAGRHLSYFRAGHFLRQLVPTGTGLRAWLLGAIRTVAPRFPVPPNMEPQVKECLAAIQHNLTGPQRDALRSMTQKLVEAAPELDMKRWMAGIDLSADRIGFVLSNDLKIANAVIEASPEDSSSVSRRERVAELMAYSTSEAYFDLRKRIGIALGS